METMNFSDLNEENNQAAPKAPRNKKLIWTGVVLAVLILSVIGWQYWQYTHSMYYQQIRAVRELEKMAKESDKYGGKTPEETVRLFTEAVKKSDFELASKYGNRERIMPVLEKMKTEGKIDQLTKWLTTGELQEISGFGGNDFNLIVKENNQKIWILSTHKSDGGTWKIDEF